MPLNPVVTWFERFLLRLSRLHPDHFRIARAAFWVGLFTISAKLIAAGKEIAVAWRYGRGAEVDAYNLALTLSTWLPMTLVSVMTVVLVPVLAGRSAGQSQHRQFLSELNGIALWCALGIMAIVTVFGVWAVSWYGHGLPAATLEMTRNMLYSFIPLSALMLFVGVHMVRMQACHDHSYALAEGLPALAIILLLWAWQTIDSLPLVAGTLLGTALQAIWLARRAHGHDGSVGMSIKLQSTEWSMLWRSGLVMGIGQFAISLTTPIDQYFAAGLGTGAIATLGYANRLISIGMALGASIISRATLPIFSEAVAKGQLAHISHLSIRWTCFVIIAGAALAGSCYLATPWLVKVVLQRGAFDTQDTMVVANVIRHGIWQWPLYFGSLVLIQYAVAAKRYRLVAISGGIAVLIKILANTAMTPIFGVGGIVLGSVAMYMATLCWFIWCSTRYIGQNDFK